MRARCTVPALLAVLMATQPGSAEPPQGLDAATRKAVHVALERGELTAAEERLAALGASAQGAAEARYLRGLVNFYAGRYAEAAGQIDEAVSMAPRSPGLAARRQVLKWVQAARDATRNYQRVRSDDGRFEILFAPGPDEVLVPYAMEALRRADAAVGKHLASRAPGPIRLEIYPNADTLAAVSSLTLDHIRTSGTIALCKWNRLMIASPRSLLRGYPWLDTITHELTHLLLTRESHNEAPVWFHEGTAKLLERTWRGEVPGAGLSPGAEYLLIRAAHDSKLMPFDRLHPSIAMLPSQEQAALAFAQVATFLERFHQQHGDSGLQAAVRAVARGEDIRDALASVAGQSFAALEHGWRQALAARPIPEKAGSPLRRRLRVEGAEPDESLDVAEKRARRHMRLGDLLWGRGRHVAAAREYERAHRHAPGDPILASRLGRAALEAGQPEQAVEPLRKALEAHPEHAPLHALLGAALVALDRKAEAIEPLREALRINPFDPSPHCDLARATQDAAEKKQERDACRALGGNADVAHTAIGL